MFRCPSDILIRSWLFTAWWSTWPGNHLVLCVAELVGFCMPIHAYRCRPDLKCLFCPSGLSLSITKVWLSCHMWKDWVRHLQEFWNLTASPQLTVLTERYRTLWFVRRTRSRMKQRPNWSIVSLARTAPALMLERQAGSSVWGSRNTRKK